MNQTVNGRTRAGLHGRVIFCPHCGESVRVFHFAWAGLTCKPCGKMINKPEWKTAPWKYSAPFNAEFLGATPPRMDQDY